jgi:nicotinamidase-related amidase
MHVASKRLRANDSFLVLVDVQDKLLAKIPAATTLIRNAGFLLDVAASLDVSVLATEQYPKGLGPTHAELLRRLRLPPLPKTCFSCCGAEAFLAALEPARKPNVVLMGMETHVCIAQTALDLVSSGFQLFLPVDALGSRNSLDHDTALRRLESAGAVLTTVEAIAFEWVADASHPQFKSVSRMVIERSSASG